MFGTGEIISTLLPQSFKVEGGEIKGNGWDWAVVAGRVGLKTFVFAPVCLFIFFFKGVVGKGGSNA